MAMSMWGRKRGEGKAAARLVGELQKALDSAKNLQRLPKACMPNLYTICLKPNTDDNTFEGSESIAVTLLSNTKHITLNSVDLVITKVMWEEDVTENRQEPVEIQPDREKGTLKMLFDPFLIPSKGCLRINFKGRMTDKKLFGWYRINGKPVAGTLAAMEGDSKSRWTLVTRFDPSDARRVFPCWDEPDVKAAFDIFLIIPNDKTVLTNMEEKVSYPHKKNHDLKILEFKRTPLMPTCSIGLVIGDFEFIEAKSVDDVIIRIYTPEGRKEDAQFSLDVVLKLLPYFKTYFGLAFPLNKLDLVAISELSSATQDNWGILMLKWKYLLVNSQNAGAAVLQNITLSIAQGISKQWFGNVGFATFAKYIGVDQMFPEYDIWSQFVAEIHLDSMKFDALKSAQPVFVEIHNPQEIDTVFDDPYYRKAASLLRMLHRYIGDADFRKGIKKYLITYQYSNACADDLWLIMEEISSKPVVAVMNNWTKQKGFPYIKVSAKQDGKNRVLKLTQDRFSFDASNKEKGQKDLWMIPLTITTGNKPNKVIKEMLMDSKAISTTILDVSKNQWVKINPGTVGYYRVRYPQEILAQFIPAIRAKTMMPLDRLGLLDDVFALVQAGFGPTVEVLSLAEAFAEEDEYVVRLSISHMFEKLLSVFGHVEYIGNLKTFGNYIYNYIFENLGWEPKPNEGHLQTILRTLVLKLMIKFGNEKVLEKAMELYDLKTKKGIPIPVDLRQIVYNGVLSRAEDDIVKLFIRIYRDTDSNSEKELIAHAFEYLTNPKHIKLLLEFSMSDDVRKQDSVPMLIALSKSKPGREICWSYLKDNWTVMRSKFTGTHLPNLIKGITEGFFTEEKAIEVTEFSRDHMVTGCERAYSQSIEWIRVNDAWLKRESASTMMKDF